MDETKPRVVTTQRTSKPWKLLQLLGVTLILTGATWFFLVGGLSSFDQSRSMDETGRAIKAIVLGGCGVPLWVAGRLGGWWFHG